MTDDESAAKDNLDQELRDAGKQRPRTPYRGGDYYRDQRPGK